MAFRELLAPDTASADAVDEISLGVGTSQRWIDFTTQSWVSLGNTKITSSFNPRTYSRECHGISHDVKGVSLLGVLITKKPVHVLIVREFINHFELVGSFLYDLRVWELEGSQPEYLNCLESFTTGTIRLG